MYAHRPKYMRGKKQIYAQKLEGQELKQWPHSSYVVADDGSHMLLCRQEKNQGARDATRFEPLVMVIVISGGRSGGGQVMTWQLS